MYTYVCTYVWIWIGKMLYKVVKLTFLYNFSQDAIESYIRNRYEIIPFKEKNIIE